MGAEQAADDRQERHNNKPDDGEWFRFNYALCEAIAYGGNLTLNQIRIIHYIARMTWGWNRKFFIFRQKEAAEKLGMDKGEMSRAYNALIQADVLITKKGEVAINKYTDEWNLNHLESKKRKLGNSQQVVKNPTSCEKPNQKLGNSQPEVVKNPTSTGPKPANSADLDGSKDNTKDKKDNNPLNPPEGDRVDGLFEEAWEAYPKRAGGNSKKAARKAWDARIKQGAGPELMLAGVKRYRAFCDATGKTGLETVKMAATFFGPSDWYLEPWDVPGQPSSKTAPQSQGGAVTTYGLAPGVIFGWG